MPLDDLAHRHRPADGEPEGALVLLHGRGVDENDLFPLLDLLDPGRRLAAFTPRAPLRLEGQPGNHWYVVERVGFPHKETFDPTLERLGSWMDGVAEDSGVPPQRTVIGGFSQGGAMSYALGLGAGHPKPAALLCLSCFIPTVEGWAAELGSRSELPVYHSHGVADPVIPVDFGREARESLEGQVDLTYREHPGGHTIDPRAFDEMRALVQAAVSPRD